MEGGRVQTTLPFYSYLKVAEGCSNCCTYCAIPAIRGKFRSVPMETLIEEAKGLAEHGVKELNIIAQDSTRYGEDLYGESKLPELLTELCRIDKLKWIRILYCYPERITDKLLNVIAKEDKIVKYIDVPIQHCCEDILKKMNREGNEEYLRALMTKIREKVPNVLSVQRSLRDSRPKPRSGSISSPISSGICASTGWAASPIRRKRVQRLPKCPISLMRKQNSAAPML